MYSEIKIFLLFPKGQGGNVFIKSSPVPIKSADCCVHAGDDLGICDLKFIFFALEFIQKCVEGQSQQF